MCACFSCPSTNTTNPDSLDNPVSPGNVEEDDPVERPAPSSSPRSSKTPFTCSTCSKTLSSKHALSLHQHTVHLGARNHPCALCSHRAKQSANLQRHTWSHHCPERLMEQLRRKKEKGKVSAARLWREAVEPVWEALWAQLSVRNQEQLTAQRRHFKLLAKSEQILGLDQVNADSNIRVDKALPGKELPVKMVSLKPLPLDKLKMEEEAPLETQNGIPGGRNRKRRRKRRMRRELLAKRRKEATLDRGEDENEMARLLEREVWMRPCLTCSVDHDTGAVHPLAELLREGEELAKDKKSKPGKEVDGLLECHMCCGRFACRDQLLLSVHQAHIHSFLPAHTCPDCPSASGVFGSATELALHRWRSHGARCPFCGPTGDDGGDSDPGHEDDHRVTDPSLALVCDLCQVAFVASDELGLALHLLETHTSEHFWKACCNFCPKRFLRREDWNEHLRWAHQGCMPRDLKKMWQ